LDTTSNQSLDAGSSSDDKKFEVNAFFPHVTFFLRNGIDNMLKVFSGSDCHVDGIETRRLCSKDKKNGAHDTKDGTPPSPASVPPGCLSNFFHPLPLSLKLIKTPILP
jgi:hypothetical protein